MTHYVDQHMRNPAEERGRLVQGFRLLAMSEFAPVMSSDSDAYVVLAFNGAESSSVVDGPSIPLSLYDVEFPRRPNLTSNPEFLYSQTSRVRVHSPSHIHDEEISAQARIYFKIPIEQLEEELRQSR